MGYWSSAPFDGDIPLEFVDELAEMLVRAVEFQRANGRRDASVAILEVLDQLARDLQAFENCVTYTMLDEWSADFGDLEVLSRLRESAGIADEDLYGETVGLEGWKRLPRSEWLRAACVAEEITAFSKLVPPGPGLTPLDAIVSELVCLLVLVVERQLADGQNVELVIPSVAILVSLAEHYDVVRNNELEVAQRTWAERHCSTCEKFGTYSEAERISDLQVFHRLQECLKTGSK